jgi:pimeloyl-ACP methyl ester carboxylesterase
VSATSPGARALGDGDPGVRTPATGANGAERGDAAVGRTHATGADAAALENAPAGELRHATGSHAAELDAVRSSLLRLAERFRTEEAGRLTATFAIAVDGHPPATITVRDGRCTVSPGAATDPDATLHASVSTWLELVDGRVDGVAAFLAGRLEVRGDLGLAARFETLFAPGPEATRVLRATSTPARGARVEALVAGVGQPVLLLHGLGANTVSFLPTLDGLADRFEVHALDLPGFGRSAKPLPTGRRYTMPWFADVVASYLELNGLRDAHVVGNSMGARIGLELALRRPAMVRSLVGLSAAVGLDEYRRVAPLLRFARPHWVGLAPVPVAAARIERIVRELFHDPSRLPGANHRAAAEDVARALRDPSHRMALLASARALGSERSRGRRAYWSRLALLQAPSYWIFGEQDHVVSSRYATRVAAALPDAVVDVWPQMGHVPQFEDPERTNRVLGSWLSDHEGPS